MMIDINELLMPAVEAFKQEAERAIEEVTERMQNVLRVTYMTTPEMTPEGCPAPRMQLRWEEHDESSRTCHYEFVFPLYKLDIRSTDGNGSRFGIVELGRTQVTGGRRDWIDDLSRAIPFRDGSHVVWDSHHFGNPPIYVISPTGKFAVAQYNRA